MIISLWRLCMLHRALREHWDAKEKITQELVDKVQKVKEPMDAVKIVCSYTVVEACALLDSLIPLFSALILVVINMNSRNGDIKAQQIIKRAKKLQIRGIKGVCHARNQFFEETGIFVG